MAWDTQGSSEQRVFSQISTLQLKEDKRVPQGYNPFHKVEAEEEGVEEKFLPKQLFMCHEVKRMLRVVCFFQLSHLRVIGSFLLVRSTLLSP